MKRARAAAPMRASATQSPRTAQRPPRYPNPVLDADFPDPATLRGDNGYTYVYATQGRGANI